MLPEFIPFYGHINSLAAAEHSALWQTMSNHVVFGQAEQKVNAAFEHINSTCPIDGSREEWSTWMTNMSPYEKRIYSLWPKHDAFLSGNISLPAISLSVPEIDGQARSVLLQGRYNVNDDNDPRANKLLEIQTARWHTYIVASKNGGLSLDLVTEARPSGKLVTSTSIPEAIGPGDWFHLSMAMHDNEVTAQCNLSATVTNNVPIERVTQVGWINVTGTSTGFAQANLKNITWWTNVSHTDALTAMGDYFHRSPWPSLYRRDSKVAARCLFHSVPRNDPIGSDKVANDMPYAYQPDISGFSWNTASASITGSLNLFSGTSGNVIHALMPALVFNEAVTDDSTRNLSDLYLSEMNEAIAHDEINDFTLLENVSPYLKSEGGAWMRRYINASVDIIDQTIAERRKQVLLPWEEQYVPFIHPTAQPGTKTELQQQEAISRSLDISKMMVAGGPDMQSYQHKLFSSGSTGATRTWFMAHTASSIGVPGANIIGSNSSWMLASMLLPETGSVAVAFLNNDIGGGDLITLQAHGSRYAFQIGTGTVLGSFYGRPNDQINFAYRYGSLTGTTRTAFNIFRNGVHAGVFTSSVQLSMPSHVTGTFRPNVIFRDIFACTASSANPNFFPRWENDTSAQWLYGHHGWNRVAPIKLDDGDLTALNGTTINTSSSEEGGMQQVFFSPPLPVEQPSSVGAPSIRRWQQTTAALGEVRDVGNDRASMDMESSLRPIREALASKEQLFHDNELLPDATIIMDDHDGNRNLDQHGTVGSKAVLTNIANILKLFDN